MLCHCEHRRLYSCDTLSDDMRISSSALGQAFGSILFEEHVLFLVSGDFEMGNHPGSTVSFALFMEGSDVGDMTRMRSSIANW